LNMTIDCTASLLSLTVEAGLAAEQALLDSICAGERDAAVLAWQPNDRALVMPLRYQRSARFPAVCKALNQQRWPIIFRLTGGEPVPQSPQVINVAMVRRCRLGESGVDFEWAYLQMGSPWCAWLQAQGVAGADLGPVSAAYCDGRFNVRIQGRKLVGTAQRWRRVRHSSDMAVLVHGAMQFDGDPSDLVTVVNDFQAGIDAPRHFQAERHIALREAIPDFQPQEISVLLAGYPAPGVNSEFSRTSVPV